MFHYLSSSIVSGKDSTIVVASEAEAVAVFEPPRGAESVLSVCERVILWTASSMWESSSLSNSYSS